MKIFLYFVSIISILSLLSCSSVEIQTNENMDLIFLGDTPIRKLSDMLKNLKLDQKTLYCRAIDIYLQENIPGNVGGFDDSLDHPNEVKIDLFLNTILQSVPILDDMDLLDSIITKNKLNEI